MHLFEMEQTPRSRCCAKNISALPHDVGRLERLRRADEGPRDIFEFSGSNDGQDGPSTTYDLRRGRLEEYFDRTASRRGERLDVRCDGQRDRDTVRAGRDRMRATAVVAAEDMHGLRLLDGRLRHRRAERRGGAAGRNWWHRCGRQLGHVAGLVPPRI